MSIAVLATVISATLAVACAGWLARCSARQQDSAVRQAYRWIAVAAVLWGGGIVAVDNLAGAGIATSFSLADLPGLLGLGTMVIGLAKLCPGSTDRVHPVRAALDGCVLACSLFVIGWLTLFAAEYRRSGIGAAAFAVGLAHPLAGLIALGVGLGFAVRAGRRGAAAYLALLAMVLGDSLAVGARITGMVPGVWALLVTVAAFSLLAAVTWGNAGVQGTRQPDSGPAEAEATTQAQLPGIATVVVAGIAAAAVTGFALAGEPVFAPALGVAGGLAMLALVARASDLAVRDWQQAGAQARSQFRHLAARTSDVVLVCDLDGTVRYASPAISDYGYAADDLVGKPLADLIHPDDAARGSSAFLAAAAEGEPPPDRVPYRIRSADGTWRHVEATISGFREPEAPDRLLITARDVSDQVALRRQVTQLTFTDGLTGLPNRAYIEDRAKRLARPPARAGMPGTGAIFVDLDGFTGVNDSVGHGAGDLLLAQAARRLRATVSSAGTVARWGGDEFAVLIEGASTAQEVVDIAERVALVIAAEPFRAADRDIPMTASVGVALADGSDPAHLLRNADVAMSRAKESGGGRVEVFASHMHADLVRRLELASDLRVAVTGGGLALDYQPVVELATSRVTTVEALVRWSRGGEPVQPAEFLGIAEESGLIVQLGDWVLRGACAQGVRWRNAGWLIGISVNVSPRQATAPGFADSVLAALEDTGLPAMALTLEVAERALIEGGSVMSGGLGTLRAHGIRLAIDDFGTGYASLAYLRQLPVDILKIDPSFVAGLGTDPTLAMLTRTIVQVSRDLGIEVVAEGIERPEQLTLLQEMGCGLGQGFLIARPVSAREIEGLRPGGEASGPQRRQQTAASAS
jgi:diguanylate cyclase (GGDEF)-like protein/PAS domain S-box-containing protein